MKTRILLILPLLAISLSGCSKFISYHFEVNDNLEVSSSDCRKIKPDSLIFPHYQEALAHAPILWFADDEEYFPTLPFFSAFDGVDNNGDGKKDLEDLQEIAPQSNPAPGSLVSLDTLHLWYRTLSRDGRKRLTAVLYTLQTIPANKVGKILFSDEQAWLRLDRKVKSYLQDSRKKLTVYKYYFYYIHDNGIRGHPEDIEFVFNFVPQDTLEFFGIMVGAGHSDFVPNNVLLYGPDDIPVQFCSHLHILVELGGHSTAPDIKGNGFFEPGVDVNWHTENPWGTRDIQAIASLGATARYQTWMAFARSEWSKVFPPDPALLAEKQDSLFCYRLLPVEKFKTLDSLFSIDSRQPNLQDTQPLTASKKIRTELQSLDSFQFSNLSLGLLSDTAIMHMSLWTNSLRARISDKPEYTNQDKNNHKVWKHSAYTSLPTEIFKSYLFRPRKYGMLGLWGQIEQSSRPEVRLAWLTPAWAWRIVPMKVDGVTEIHLGWRAPLLHSGFKNEKWVIGVYYERYYANPFSWYLNLTFMNNRPDLPDFTFGGGLSIQAPFVSLLSKNPLDLFRWFRIRLGLRAPIHENAFQFNDSHLELQLGIHH